MNPFVFIIIYLLSLSTAYAIPSQSFFFFGDSLTDSGYQNNNPTVIQLGKSPQWTSPHGHTWPYYFLKHKGQQASLSPNNVDAKTFFHPVPSHISPVLDGNNFAAGGSTTGGKGVLNTRVYKSPSLLQQIDYFLHTYVPQHKINVAKHEYLIWSGDNDLLKKLTVDLKIDYILHKLYLQKLAAALHIFDMQRLSPTFKTTEIQIANHLLAAVTALQEAGAEKIIVMLLPDISDSPLINDIVQNLQQKTHSTLTQGELSAQMHTIVMDTNALIREKLRHSSVLFIDANNVLHALSVMKTPGYFHETSALFGQSRRFFIANNKNGACLPNQLALSCIPKVPHANHYVFEDLAHPTDQTHQILGDYVYYQSTVNRH